MMAKSIHFCSFCNYNTNRKCDRDRHMLRKHNDISDQIKYPLPQTDELFSCSFCNCKFNKKYNLKTHMKIIHNFNDNIEEAGTQTDMNSEKRFQKEDILNLINEGINIYQNYMYMKIYSTGFASEEMIEEGIDVFKCYIIHKINY